MKRIIGLYMKTKILFLFLLLCIFCGVLLADNDLEDYLGDIFKWNKTKLIFIATPVDARRRLLKAIEDTKKDETIDINLLEQEIMNALDYPVYDANDSINIYCLFGWSGNGADDMRRISILDKSVEGNIINIVINYPLYTYSEPVGGTCDMKFVNNIVSLGKLPEGIYDVNIYRVDSEVYVDYNERPPKETVLQKSQKKLEYTLKFNIQNR